MLSLLLECRLSTSWISWSQTDAVIKKQKQKQNLEKIILYFLTLVTCNNLCPIRTKYCNIVVMGHITKYCVTIMVICNIVGPTRKRYCVTIIMFVVHSIGTTRAKSNFFVTLTSKYIYGMCLKILILLLSSFER